MIVGVVVVLAVTLYAITRDVDPDLALLATLQSADIILPTTDGREIRLRRVTQPTPEQQLLLDQLDITIPTHLEWNAECSGDFVAS